MKKTKVLVTGGAGFIGTNLVRYLIDKTDWNIVVLDNLSSGKKEYIENIANSRIDFIKGDIRNREDVNKGITGCDYVVNLAAQVGVIPSVEDPLFDMNVNVKGTIILLEESVKNKIKRFVQASSAAPLGEQEMPLDESKVPRPLSPYGASKLACEGYCSAYSGSYDLSTVVLRFSNVYGPFCENKGSVIPKFIRKILNDEKITIFGDGNQTRDFVNVKDIAQGIFLALTKRLDKPHDLFQLGTGKETSINKLIKILENCFSKKIIKEYTSPRSGEIYRNYVNIKKANHILDYLPEIPIKNGIKSTKNWIEKNY